MTTCRAEGCNKPTGWVVTNTDKWGFVHEIPLCRKHAIAMTTDLKGPEASS